MDRDDCDGNLPSYYSKSALTQTMPILSGKFRQRVGDSGEVWYDLLIVST